MIYKMGWCVRDVTSQKSRRLLRCYFCYQGWNIVTTLFIYPDSELYKSCIGSCIVMVFTVDNNNNNNNNEKPW